jgi:dTDP-4-amino-4,6-dideoxygalactose transaminase
MSVSDLAAFGVTPVRTKPFPIWPRLPDASIEAACQVLKEGKLKYHPNGHVSRLEIALASVCGARHVVCVINGTLSLEIAMRSLGLGVGSAVVIPAYDHPANLNSVLNIGATPIFTDVEYKRPNLSPAGLVDLLRTKKAATVVVTHMIGLADIDAFERIAKEHGVAVIYDCARVIGSTWKGQPIGRYGTVCSFSFEESKHINAGEGGAVTTNSPELAEKIYACRNRGRDKSGKIVNTGILGSNYRMTELQAACLIPQLSILTDLAMHRTRAIKFLRALLRDIEGIHIPDFDEHANEVVHYNVTLRYDSAAFNDLDLDTAIEYLNAEGIPCAREWPLPYDYAHRVGIDLGSRPKTPNADKVHSETIVLKGNVLDAEEDELADIARALRKIQAA